MNKYKVTQEFMDSLDGWRYRWVNGELPVNAFSSENINDVVERWRFEHFSNDEIMKRLGALLNWINGEEVFKVGTPNYIVQRREIKSRAGREYLHVTSDDCAQIVYGKENATKFDNFEKALEWANTHFEVVEVDE